LTGIVTKAFDERIALQGAVLFGFIADFRNETVTRSSEASLDCGYVAEV
jgi:hypothetical protein